MSTDRARGALELFELATSIPEDQIARFLDDACTGDQRLRADVESLLAASRETDDFLPRGPEMSCSLLENDTFILGQIPRVSFGSDSEGAV